MPPIPPSFYANADILTMLGIDPNQQYIPVRHVLRSLDLRDQLRTRPAAHPRASGGAQATMDP
jgi:hypothetical protein